MPKINNLSKYSYDDDVSVSDYLIGSDSGPGNVTKNFRVADLISLVDSTLASSDKNKVLSGSIYWIEGLAFGSTEIVYIYGGIISVIAPTTYLLDPADPSLPRTDVFALDYSTGTVVILKGEPNASPQEQTVNFTTQVRLTSVLVPAASTTPDNIVNEVVYDENAGEPTEWVGVVTETVASSVVLNSTDYASSGSTSIKVDSVVQFDDAYITFTNVEDIQYDLIDSLLFNVKKQDATKLRISVTLYKDDLAVSSTVNVRVGSFGFTETTSAQTINIPAETFFLSQDFNKILIAFSPVVRSDDTVTGTFYVDNIRIQSGVSAVATPIEFPDIFWGDIVGNVEEQTDLVNYILSLSKESILSGSVFWVENLDFASTNLRYIFNGSIGDIPANTYTLSPSDVTNDRIDVFAVDSTTNTIVVVEGTPAADPQEPTIDFTTQLRITSVLIKANATDPSDPGSGTDFTDQLVYNENAGEPTEWTTTNTSTPTSNVELASTESPATDAVSIKFVTPDFDSVHSVRFVNDAAVSATTYNALNFQVTKTSITRSNARISIAFVNGSVPVARVIIEDGNYGFSDSTLTTQTINIPFADVGIASEFDTIIMQIGEARNRPPGDMFIDNVKLINSLVIPSPTSDSYISLTDTADTDYVGKDGFVPTVDEVNGRLVLQAMSAIVTNTSDLANDGEDGVNPFIDATDISGFITDAPSDGSQYARKDAGWEVVAVGGSGTVTSVAVSVSDGIEVDSGSPITTSGTIALGLNKASTLTFLNVADGAEVNTINSDVAGEPAGSDTVDNVVSLTQAEYDAGTPVAGTFYVITDAKEDLTLMVAFSDQTTVITTGTDKRTFRMPFAMTLTDVRAGLKTADDALFTVDINEGGTSILSTKLTIDSGENTSLTAATPAVISDANLADDAVITIDVDTAGTAAVGGQIVLIGKSV